MDNISLKNSYTIYTGKSIWTLVLRYVVLDLLLGIFASILIPTIPFLEAKSPIMVSVLFITAAVFATMQTGVIVSATKADCYLFTLKKRRKIYLNVYFTTYFAMLAAMLVLLGMIYFKSAFYHTMIEKPSLCFLLDMECLLLYFAVLPFTFTNKTLAGVWPKNLIVLLVYILISALVLIQPLWIEAIVLVVIVPIVGVWSNKRWIKKISEVM